MKFLSVFIFVFCSIVVVHSQTTVQLGEIGNGDYSSWNHPISVRNHYVYSQIIYTKDEILNVIPNGGLLENNVITELYLIVKPDYSLSNDKTIGTQIYMKNIDENDNKFVSYTDFFDVSNQDEVFNGEFTLPPSENLNGQDHIIRFELNKPFIWDGSSNIMIAFNETEQEYDHDNRVILVNFYTYQDNFDYQLLRYQDSTDPVDVNNLQFATSSPYHHSPKRDKPIIRLTFTDGSEQNTSGNNIINQDSLGVDTLSVTNFAHFQGLAQFDGPVQLNGLTTVENPLQNGLLLINEDGFIERGGLDVIINAMYSPYPNQLQCYEGWRPTWGNDEEGNLFTTDLGSCKVNVGIGTDTPESRLHVIGDIRGNTLTLGRPANKPASLTIFRTTNNPEGLSPLLNLGYYNATENQEYSALTFTAQGQLVIRNANEKILQLESDGLLRAREIKVDLDAWPDYVFEETYELMSLPDLKQFIQQNGHLPNVPTATEIEDDGVNLGEAARINMEKIEELTLYILQQQEQLDEHKRLIEENRKLFEEQAKLVKLNNN